ncbi:hypothetical protein FHW23_002252 [Curtobacterium pusillum]|uniref:Uncharacterized protein n=1 Tax=Curtobacterium pusillum TaxID=69373 RepID=A0AAW3T9B9_9MICO|nr:hypothetical protein [Curtobacterium pusillum]MBA8990987.1 hypothetical protein [Curtobacterium pusillum]
MRRWPWWLAALVLAVAFGGLWFLVTMVAMPELSAGDRGVISAITGSAYGIVMAIFLVRQRRGYGAALQHPGFRRAVRRAVVPPDIDIARWRRAVQQHRNQYRPLRWAAPLLYVPMTGISIWLAVTGQPLWWIFAGLFVAMLIGSLIVAPRVLRRTDAMLTELDRREQSIRSDR